MPRDKNNGLAERLKETARLSGLKAETLAERLGVSPSAVWAWWSGRNEPPVDILVAYARAVNVSVQFLVGGHDQPMGPSGTVLEWTLRVNHLRNQGLTAEEAIDRITGPKPTGVEGWDLSPEEREILSGPPDAVNASLDALSGGDWSRLPPDAQKLILQLIARLAPPEDGNGEKEPP